MKKLAFLFLLMNIYSVSIAQYSWQPVGGGIGTNASHSCQSLITDSIGGQLFVGGRFILIDDSIECSSIGIWNGTNWSTNTSPGVSLISAILCFYNGHLYSAFSDGNSCLLSRFDTGINWLLEATINAPVYSLCVYHNKLYVGGEFTMVNGIPAKCLASYDGTSWSEVGGGVDWTQACCADVRALHVWNDKLYVGGTFDKVGNLDSTNSIACWNDTAWSRLGTGLIQTAPVPNAYVYAIEDYNDEIYVGGIINQAGATPVNGICRWMNGAWYDVGGGLDGTPKVNCLLNKDGYLYIGGGFGSAGGLSYTNGICKWDGVNFSSVGGADLHFGGYVNCMAEYNDDLYIGGNFPQIGSVVARNIARYGLINSVNEVSETEFSLYPNPATDNLQLQWSDLQVTEINVTDITGRTLQTQTIAEQPNSQFSIINCQLFSPGIYLLTLKTKDGKRVVKKFVKE